MRGYSNPKGPTCCMSEVKWGWHQPCSTCWQKLRWLARFWRQIAQKPTRCWAVPTRVLIFDESGFVPRKARHLTGFPAREWPVGKVITVSSGLATCMPRWHGNVIDASSICGGLVVTMKNAVRKAIPEEKTCFKVKRSWRWRCLKIAQQRGIQFGDLSAWRRLGRTGVSAWRWWTRLPVCSGCPLRSTIICRPEPLVPEWSGRGRQPLLVTSIARHALTMGGRSAT